MMLRKVLSFLVLWLLVTCSGGLKRGNILFRDKVKRFNANGTPTSQPGVDASWHLFANSPEQQAKFL